MGQFLCCIALYVCLKDSKCIAEPEPCLKVGLVKYMIISNTVQSLLIWLVKIMHVQFSSMNRI